MRLVALSLVSVVALSACAALPPPRPESVEVSRSGIEVTLTDRSTCIGIAPDGQPDSWSGTLQGCPVPYAYAVEIDPRTNPVRYLLEEVIGLTVAPIATVTITDVDGRSRVFASPEPRED